MTDKILEVRGLTKTYGGDKKKGAKQPTPTLDVLKGIDIDIYRGDVVCLIGPSGCGKSTFLRCLNRLEIPTGGSIKFEGVEIDDSHIDAVRQKMGMVFQHFNLFPHLTVKQNLCLAPTLLKLKNQQEADKRADAVWRGASLPLFSLFFSPCSFIPPLKKLLTHKKIRTGIPDKIQNAGIFKSDRQKSIYPCQNTREHKSRLRSY